MALATQIKHVVRGTTTLNFLFGPHRKAKWAPIAPPNGAERKGVWGQKGLHTTGRFFGRAYVHPEHDGTSCAGAPPPPDWRADFWRGRRPGAHKSHHAPRGVGAWRSSRAHANDSLMVAWSDPCPMPISDRVAEEGRGQKERVGRAQKDGGARVRIVKRAKGPAGPGRALGKRVLI